MTTEKLDYATDFCGVKSGRDVDKFEKLKLTREKADFVKAPMIAESPVSIECRVAKVEELGSHHLFLAEVVAVHADEEYLDETGKFQWNKTRPLAYSHGEYFGLGKKIGKFGYSVRKRRKKERDKR